MSAIVRGTKVRKMFAMAGAAVLLASTAGCSSVGDAVGSFNPFREKEKILAGERKAILAATDPVADLGGSAKTASYAGLSAFGDWSQPGGNVTNDPGHVSLSGGANWRATAGDAGSGRNLAVTASPLVYGGRAFVYDPNGNVTAVSAGNGGRVWRTSLKPEGEREAVPGGGIAAADGRIFAATGYRQVVALDAGSGAQAWAKDLDDPARGAPTVAGGKVYVVTATQVLYALSAADGSELWSYRGIPETAGLLSNASPAVAANTVVVPYSSGEIVAFDATTGKMKWIDTVVRGARTSAIAALNDVAARPVIHDGIVYATGISGRMVAVKLANGERLWETNIGSASTPIVSGESIFVVDMSERVLAVSRRNGDLLWATQLPVGEKKKREKWSGPSLAGGSLWVASSKGNLYALNPATGQITGTRAMSAPVYTSPIAASGSLFVLSGNGTLNATN
ncbi:MAG: PQQ-binding-like beta-propeller repeat protein [Hyphomicrobiales bacterium]